MEDNLKVYQYTLTSSNEVSETVLQLSEINTRNVLIHIISFIHNTVLVHKLEKELIRKFPGRVMHA